MDKAYYEELKQAWGEWLSGLADWELFCMLTFRDPEGQGTWTKPGFATAKRAWGKFIAAAQPALGELSYVSMFEMQHWRGVPHIHALVGNVDKALRRMDLVDFGNKNFGYTRVYEYEAEKGAAYYLCKYVTKDIADIEFSRNLG